MKSTVGVWVSTMCNNILPVCSAFLLQELDKLFSASRKKLSYVQEQVFMKLLQILPNHNPNDIYISVEDTKNNKAPLTIEILLQRCLEDLLAVASCSSQNAEEIASNSKNGIPDKNGKLDFQVSCICNHKPVFFQPRWEEEGSGMLKCGYLFPGCYYAPSSGMIRGLTFYVSLSVRLDSCHIH